MSPGGYLQLPIFLTEPWESICLGRMIENMPQLVDMKFMQVMIFLNHHSQMTFRISNTYKASAFDLFLGKVEYVAFETGFKWPVL